MGTIASIGVKFTSDTTGLKKGTDSARSVMSSFGSTVLNTSMLLKGAFAAAAGSAAVAGLAKMAGAAASADDAVSKMRAVFREQADDVINFSQKMAKGYGLSLGMIYEETGNLGALFRGADFDDNAVSEYSQTFVRLANDLTAFNGGTVEESLSKIKAGLIGSSEPLQSFGIFLDEDTVKAKAYAMGLAKVGQELTAGQKMQARANLILGTSKKLGAVGQASREVDSASAKIAAFWGNLENLSMTIGATFAPAMGSMLGGLSTSIEFIAQAWTSATTAVWEWFGGSTDAMNGVGGGINIIEVGIGALANAWQYVTIAFKAVKAGLWADFALIIKGLSYVAKGFDKLLSMAGLGESGVTDFFQTWADDLQTQALSSIDDVKKAWAEPYASEGISKQFQDIRDNAQKVRDELAKKPMELPAVITPDAKSSGKTGDLFASAMKRGSAEAVSLVLKSRYGGGGKDSVAENTKRTADTSDQLLAVGKETMAAIKLMGGGLGLAAI